MLMIFWPQNFAIYIRNDYPIRRFAVFTIVDGLWADLVTSDPQDSDMVLGTYFELSTSDEMGLTPFKFSRLTDAEVTNSEGESTLAMVVVYS